MSSDISIIHSRSILSPEELNHSDISTTVWDKGAETLVPDAKNAKSPAQPSLPTDTHQFLRLTLLPDVPVLLPMEHVSEVLTIPLGQVVPIPSMPAWVMGIYNLRGDILWIANISHFLELLPWQQQYTCASTYTIVVLCTTLERFDDEQRSLEKSSKIGLIVNKTEDIEWCNSHDVQATSKIGIRPTLSQFLQGYWSNKSGEILAVLDGKAISEEMSNPSTNMS